MWQPKDQPLRVYRASQHDLLLEIMVVREPVVSETCSDRTCSFFFFNPTTAHSELWTKHPDIIRPFYAHYY